MKIPQFTIAAFVLLLAAVFGVGALNFPNDAGYAGISSRFVPSLIAIFLLAVGVLLMWQAFTGGFRNFTDSLINVSADYRGALWVSAGILLMAALISYIGFVISASMLFVLAARGFGSTRLLRDLLIGVALVLPVYWLFGQVLDVSLPMLVNRWL
jgi:putative tricarboxylic transport membrane protein